MKLKKNKSIQRFIKSKGGKQIKEGTCGYGLNGKLGEEPAGPNLRKKIKDISKDKNESRNKSLGEKDLMKYLMKRFKFNKKASATLEFFKALRSSFLSLGLERSFTDSFGFKI